MIMIILLSAIEIYWFGELISNFFLCESIFKHDASFVLKYRLIWIYSSKELDQPDSLLISFFGLKIRFYRDTLQVYRV